MKPSEQPMFNYAVGFYWKSGAIGVYTSGSVVQFGTMEDAKAFQAYCQKQNKDREYKIFQLVEVPE